MLKLYFGNIFSIISTGLILVFGVIFWQAVEKRSTITKWGILVLLVFFLGLFMSMMSGMKDGMGSASSVIPLKHWMMTALCILGGLAILIGVVAMIIRRQAFWQINFYLLSAIILAKTVLTEGYRIYDYFKRVGLPG